LHFFGPKINVLESHPGLAKALPGAVEAHHGPLRQLPGAVQACHETVNVTEVSRSHPENL